MIFPELSNPSASLYGFVMKVFGEVDRVDDAIDLFHMMLKDQSVIPTIYTFNNLLNTCALSKSLGYKVFDRATELIEMLGTNERCVQFQLRPDKVTYNTLLKCLTKSCACIEDASALAETILLEMEERHKHDPTIHPTLVTFNLAINVCLLVNDQDRMNAIMNMMEQYNLRADARLCNTILNYYAQTGTPESAERAESFISNIKQMSQTDVSVRPNIYTYNIVLNAWARSNHPQFAHRMWMIYESMLSDQVIPDEVTYNTMLSVLTKSRNNTGLADKLLLESEKSRKSGESTGRYQPGHKSYTALIKAYIKYSDAERATELLFRWLSVLSDSRAMPERRSHVLESMTFLYHKLAQLWIRLGDLERATNVIEQIYDLHMNEGNKQSLVEPPSFQTYALLHNFWNKSSHQSKDVNVAKIKERIDSYQQM